MVLSGPNPVPPTSFPLRAAYQGLEVTQGRVWSWCKLVVAGANSEAEWTLSRQDWSHFHAGKTEYLEKLRPGGLVLLAANWEWEQQLCWREGWEASPKWSCQTGEMEGIWWRNKCKVWKSWRKTHLCKWQSRSWWGCSSLGRIWELSWKGKAELCWQHRQQGTRSLCPSAQHGTHLSSWKMGLEKGRDQLQSCKRGKALTEKDGWALIASPKRKIKICCELFDCISKKEEKGK